MSFQSSQATASIFIPRQSNGTANRNTTQPHHSTTNNGLKIVKSFNQSNSLTSPINQFNYLFTSLSPQSPTSFKVVQFLIFLNFFKLILIYVCV